MDDMVSQAIYECARIKEISEEDPLEEWRSIFLNLQILEMGQGWLKKLQEGFRPARVRMGWAKKELRVLAEIEDADIFNPSVGMNEYAYALGDVFEIFLRPVGQESYWEFHVTPSNQLFQLNLPDASAIDKARGSRDVHQALETYKVWKPLIRTKVDAMADRWWVKAVIPLSELVRGDGRRFDPDERWRFSFSRYDYTRGRKEAVISSTSPHSEPNFHGLGEWGMMRLEP